MIKEDSIDILKAAKAALDDIKYGNIERARDFIEYLSSISDYELELLLEKLQHKSYIDEARFLFFDVIYVVRNIKSKSLLALRAIKKKKYKDAKNFLRYIIGLEKTEINEINKIDKIISSKEDSFWDRYGIEIAFSLVVRNKLYPHTSNMAEKLDEFFSLKDSLEKKIRKKIPGVRFISFDEELKQDIFGKEQVLLQADSLNNIIKHPIIIPHANIDIDFKRVFDDYIYVAVLGIISYSVLTKNFFYTLRKLRFPDKIKRLYISISRNLSQDFNALVAEYKRLTREIEGLNKKLIRKDKKLESIASRKELEKFMESYNRLFVSSKKILKKAMSDFEIESQKAHDAVIAYVLRKKEKVPIEIENAFVG